MLNHLMVSSLISGHVELHSGYSSLAGLVPPKALFSISFPLGCVITSYHSITREALFSQKCLTFDRSFVKKLLMVLAYIFYEVYIII